jgi:pimeloyl-ACP methyl ester carboxylesterase
VLLVHGSGGSLHSVAALSDAMSASFDVIRLDLPGFGLTGPRADRDYRVQTYAATACRFLDAIGVAQCAVVGHSLGGNIAWNLALDRPGRVSALVLVNATGYPEKALPAAFKLMRNPMFRPLLRRWMPRGAVAGNLRKLVGPGSAIVDDAMIDRVHALSNLPGNRSALVDMVNIDHPDRSAEIRRIVAPTLVLRSRSIDGQNFVRDIAGSQELVHPDAGHLLPEEQPLWVAGATVQFLKTLEQTERPTP